MAFDISNYADPVPSTDEEVPLPRPRPETPKGGFSILNHATPVSSVPTPRLRPGDEKIPAEPATGGFDISKYATPVLDLPVPAVGSRARPVNPMVSQAPPAPAPQMGPEAAVSTPSAGPVNPMEVSRPIAEDRATRAQQPPSPADVEQKISGQEGDLLSAPGRVIDTAIAAIKEGGPIGVDPGGPTDRFLTAIGRTDTSLGAAITNAGIAGYRATVGLLDGIGRSFFQGAPAAAYQAGKEFMLAIGRPQGEAEQFGNDLALGTQKHVAESGMKPEEGVREGSVPEFLRRAEAAPMPPPRPGPEMGPRSPIGGYAQAMGRPALPPPRAEAPPPEEAGPAPAQPPGAPPPIPTPPGQSPIPGFNVDPNIAALRQAGWKDRDIQPLTPDQRAEAVRTRQPPPGKAAAPPPPPETINVPPQKPAEPPSVAPAAPAPTPPPPEAPPVRAAPPVPETHPAPPAAPPPSSEVPAAPVAPPKAAPPPVIPMPGPPPGSPPPPPKPPASTYPSLEAGAPAAGSTTNWHATAGEPHPVAEPARVQELAQHPDVAARLQQQPAIDQAHDIPYLAGYSQDGKTIFFDRHLPPTITLGGQQVDPRQFLQIHEHWEKSLIDALGYKYQGAHEVATGAEHAAVRAAGYDPAEYEAALKPFIKHDEHEQLTNVPPTLDMTPYNDTQAGNIKARMAQAQGGAAPEAPTPAQPIAPKAPEGATPPAEVKPAVTGFMTEKGSTYQVHENGTTTRTKSSHVDVGHEATDVGVKKRSAKTIYLDRTAAGLSTAGIEGGVKSRILLKDGKAGLITWNEQAGRWGVPGGTKNNPDVWGVPYHEEPAVGRYPLELWHPRTDQPGYDAYGSMHAGNKIVSMEQAKPAEKPAAPAPKPQTPQVPPLPGMTPMGKKPVAESPEKPAAAPEPPKAPEAPAKTEVEPAPVPAPAQGDPGTALAKSLYERLSPARTAKLSMKDLLAEATKAYGGTLAEGKFDRKDLYDAMELAVNMQVRDNPSLRIDDGDWKRANQVLTSILDRLPTQTVRSEEQISFQQFSTPPNYAAAVAYAAGLRGTDVVMEPSAGTGSILAASMRPGVTLVANELSARRVALLKELVGDRGRVFQENAEQIDNILPESVKPTVVVMNPPFSQTAGRMGDKKDLLVGANHISQALSRLEPGGRLVAIVAGGTGAGPRQGAGMAFDAPRYKDWWDGIRAQYDVKANIPVEGKLYAKYGTHFGTRLLVIDKVPASGVEPVTAAADTIPALFKSLEAIRDGRPAAKPIAAQPGVRPVAPGGEGAAEAPLPVQPQPSGVGIGAAGGGAGVPGPGPAGAGRPGIPPVQAAPGERGGVAPVEPERPVAPGAGAGPRPEPVGGVEPAGGSGAPPERDLQPTGGGQPRAPAGGERAELEQVVEPGEQPVVDINEDLYQPYQPQKVRIAGAKAHPGPLVESAAMSAATPPTPAYRPSIPKELIDQGALSLAQLEPIVYAGQSHAKFLPAAEGEEAYRRGFFIGDGTGVGKGREIAGIILDNWQQGRTKHVWVSEKKTLLEDARRDWSGIGQNPDHLFDVGKTKAGLPLQPQRGIGFVTYDTLKGGLSDQRNLARGAFIKGQAVTVGARSATVTGSVKGKGGAQTGVRVKFDNGELGTIPVGDVKAVEGAPGLAKTRVDQLVNWLGKDFDGVIAFDEAHNMGNAITTKGDRGKKEAAAKALAGVELQKRLPKARVVYVSATAATEVANLAYAERLGLWGRGTPFADRNAFINKIGQGGIAAMEVVAADMKRMGLYTARNLSYDGVEYGRIEHTLTPDQREIYDDLAEAWQVVLRNFEQYLVKTGGDKDRTAKSAARSAFWSGHQRFFNQIITSLQMPSVIRAVEKDIAEGRQAVLQLTNTNEASQNRAAAKAETAEDIEDLDITPKDQVIQLVETSFPTQQFETFVNEDGGEETRPVVDAEGNPVQNKEAVAARDALIERLASIRVPQGPLDMILDHFGIDNVAEVTGRGRRFVMKPDQKGNIKRTEESRSNSANLSETAAFQEGLKKILVFSEAGGTGRSYHADNTSASKNARRSHYLVQAGWRADKAVQGFGRTHRTNQASAPIFNLVTTDLQGQKRFISSIARRLSQLGALTKGQRQAGDQGVFSARDNLESREAQIALQQFYSDLMGGKAPISVEEFERQTGLQLTVKTPDGGVVGMKQNLPSITQFLNRLLSMKIDMQNAVFDTFSARLDAVIEARREAGILDTGLETVRAHKITKDSERSVYTDPESGAETKYVKLTLANRFYPQSFEDASKARGTPGRGGTPASLQQTVGYVQSPRGRVYIVREAPSVTLDNGSIADQRRLVSPTATAQTVRADALVGREGWTHLTRDQAKPLWDAEVAKAPEFIEHDLHLITGAMLPIWDRLAGDTRVVRLQTNAGENLIGRVIPSTQLASTLKALGAEGEKQTFTPQQIFDRLNQGASVTLSNGWRLKQSRVAGEERIELVGPSSFGEGEEVKKDGVFTERIQYTTRYFVPTGNEGPAVIRRLTQFRPVTNVGEARPGLEEPGRGDIVDAVYDDEPTKAPRLIRKVNAAGGVYYVPETPPEPRPGKAPAGAPEDWRPPQQTAAQDAILGKLNPYEEFAKLTRHKYVDLGDLALGSGNKGGQIQDYILANGREHGVEFMVGIDKNGDVLANGYGTRNAAGLSDALWEAIQKPGSGVVIHHNHPSNSSFSSPDLGLLGNPGLDAIWAHGHAQFVGRAALTPAASARMEGKAETRSVVIQMAYQLASDRILDAIRSNMDAIRRANRGSRPMDLGAMAADRIDGHLVASIMRDAGMLDYRSSFDVVPEQRAKLASFIERLGLAPHMLRAAREIREIVFNDRNVNPAAAALRQSVDLRAPGDVGAVFDRSREPPQRDAIAKWNVEARARNAEAQGEGTLAAIRRWVGLREDAPEDEVLRETLRRAIDGEETPPLTRAQAAERRRADKDFPFRQRMLLDKTSKELAARVEDVNQLGKKFVDALRRARVFRKDAQKFALHQKMTRFQENIDHPENQPTLTPVEQRLYDEHYKPLFDLHKQVYTDLMAFKHLMSDEERTAFEDMLDPEYVHHVVMGTGSKYDRIARELGYGPILGGRVGTGARALPISASAAKASTFYATENDRTGQRTILSQTGTGDNATTRWVNKERAGGGPKALLEIGNGYTDRNGDHWTIRRAKLGEKMQHAPVKYYQNVYATTADSILAMEHAKLGLEYFDQLTKTPQWRTMATRDLGAARERGWQQIDRAPLHGWYLAPELYQPLIDFYGGDKLLNLAGMSGASATPPRGLQKLVRPLGQTLEGMNRIATASIFAISPFPHAWNVANHWIVGRGWDWASIPGYARLLATGTQAVYHVSARSPLYRDLLRGGAPLFYSSARNTNLIRHLFDRLGAEMEAETDPQGPWHLLARAFEYPSPGALAPLMYRAATGSMWWMGDVLTMQRMLELQSRMRTIPSMALGPDAAIKSTSEHIPTYVVPPKVAGSRLLSRVLQDMMLVLFGRYRYAQYKGFFHDANRAIRLNHPRDAGAAIGRLLVTYFMATVVYDALDQFLQGLLGIPDAQMVRGGPFHIIENMKKYSEGKGGGLPGFLFTTFTPSPVVTAAIQLWTNHELWREAYGYRGPPIIDPKRDTYIPTPDQPIPTAPLHAAGGAASALGLASDISQIMQGQLGPVIGRELNVKIPYQR